MNFNPVPGENSSRSLARRADAFLAKARAKHGDRFDYSQFEYTGATGKSTIICPEHGPFEQMPSNHLGSTHGCPACTAAAPKPGRVARERGQPMPDTLTTTDDLPALRERLDRLTKARPYVLLDYRTAPDGPARTAAARMLVGVNEAEDRLRAAIHLAERAGRASEAMNG